MQLKAVWFRQFPVFHLLYILQEKDRMYEIKSICTVHGKRVYIQNESEVYLLGGGLGFGILFSTAAISFLSSKFFHWS